MVWIVITYTFYTYTNQDALGYWLAERQICGRCGGFNGRPEKAPDVCYSWWILSSLTIIGSQNDSTSERFLSITNRSSFASLCQEVFLISGQVLCSVGMYQEACACTV